MVSIRGYISTNFTKSFLTIFIPFFLIISLVYLVKIAALTAQIQLTFGELLKLYGYSIPDIVFYTLPLSFVTALANVLVRLSMDNELIALYALGLNADRIVHRLFIIAALFSLLLLVISFLAMPMSKQLYKSFKSEKRAEAKLNITPGKLGQKFGNYYIYVQEKNDDGTFKNLVIYNRTNILNEQFFAAKEGRMKREGQQSSLLLKKGYGYTYGKDTLRQAQYDTLEAFDTKPAKPYHFQDTLTYWSKAPQDSRIRHRLYFFLFVSFIPLLSVYIVAAFSMINPRYQSNHTFSVIFATTLILYLLASSLEKWGTLPLLLLALLSVFATGIYLFKKQVARYF